MVDAGEKTGSAAPGPPRPLRPLLGLAAAAATAAVGALFVGEYELRGLAAVVAGAVFGLVVGEVAVAVGRRQDLAVAVPSALLAGFGLLWAAWIWSGEPWKGVPAGAWTAVAIGVVVTLLWVTGPKLREPAPPGDGTPPEP
ncbi:MAG: hypothetical protein M3N68_11980 [Actinomycetota bacterium]|nr:hypothetical protein [Actinomycetota bacterium]